jgi:hypothetical protein
MLDAQCLEGTEQEIGLRRCTPCRALRPVAVAVARSVERDHPVPLGHPVEDAAQHPVVRGNDVAVQKHDGWTLALLEIMQPDAIHLDEPPARRVPLLGLAGAPGVEDGDSRQRGSRARYTRRGA